MVRRTAAERARDVPGDSPSSYDLSAFRLARAALTDPSYVANWMA